jgi:hypothetical protein
VSDTELDERPRRLDLAVRKETAMLWRTSVKNFQLALGTVLIVALLVGLRALLFAVGVEGMPPSVLASSIIAGGVFVMGLVIAGTLSDYKDAERAPSDLAGGLHAILREAESMRRVWGKPDMSLLQDRLVGVVHALHRDIDAGNARECQAAVEELSESFLELEESDVPASYVARLRQEQAGLRKGVLRVYHIQREEFLPSAYAMIVSFVVMIVALLMFTKIETEVVTLVTLAFLSFFFLYLLRLLNIINRPFKVGQERSDDDVSLFLLYEFVVHARSAGRDLTSEQVVQIAEQIEEAETAPVDGDETAGPGLPAVAKGAPAAVEDVIDAVTAGPGEPGTGPETRG